MKKYLGNDVGIAGYGFVGLATESALQQIPNINIRIYDKFKNTESLDSVVENSDIIFVAVPTPTNFNTGECDTSIVEGVVEEIDNIAKGKSIVIKSTVPPGTTKRLAEKHVEQNFVFNPEFLREKTFIQDALEQDRVILGTTTDEHVGYDNEVLYSWEDFAATQKHPAQMYITDSSTAETVKYMGNCFLAAKVAFCNEIYQICKAANIDYDKVAQLVALDKRIGPSHMKVPGPDGDLGFGGKCFAKDMNSLMFFARELGIDPLILESVWTKNILLRKNHDWESIPGATTDNLDFGKNNVC